jgi:hypothetical protein
MLKGITHVHTTYSFDGKLSLRDLQTFFASRNIQFVLLSEHIESLEAASINSLVDECRIVSTDDCHLIPGIEVDDLNLLIFGIREVPGYQSVDELIQILHEQGALFGYAHPVKKHAVPTSVMEMIEGFEVWNTRYDGKLMPRQTNVAMFQNLLRQNPRIRPMVGLDFHKPSDYAPVYMQVDCHAPSKILSAIRAGEYSLCVNDRPLHIYPARRSFRSWTTTAKRTLYTRLYDFTVSQHRWLAQHGLTVPRGLKMALKRIF